MFSPSPVCSQMFFSETASNCLASRISKICNKAESPKTHRCCASPRVFETKKDGTTVLFEGRNRGWVNQKNVCKFSAILELYITSLKICSSYTVNVCRLFTVCAQHISGLLYKKVTSSETIYHTHRNIEGSKVESVSPWRWQRGATLLQISFLQPPMTLTLWSTARYWLKGPFPKRHLHIVLHCSSRHVEVAARRLAICSRPLAPSSGNARYDHASVGLFRVSIASNPADRITWKASWRCLTLGKPRGSHTELVEFLGTSVWVSAAQIGRCFQHISTSTTNYR